MMRRSGRLALPLILVAAWAATPAVAQRVETFRSAGGVPGCTGTAPDMRCRGWEDGFGCWVMDGALMCQLVGAPALRPDWSMRCELNTSPTFILRAAGPAVRGCEEGLLSDVAPVLAEGGTWRRGGIRCENRRGALRCVNRAGRGFRIHPRRQELL